uniref:Lipase domain-containing protein n=1 Tax=Clastoptera arizonana TaxID=38151 RepID=A0A1B6E914_9HEMI
MFGKMKFQVIIVLGVILYGQGMDSSEIKIRLYKTGEYPRYQEVYINATDELFNSPWYNISNPSVIFIHGLAESCNSYSAINSTSALTTLDYNVFCLDWGALAYYDFGINLPNATFYPVAAQNTIIVGNAFTEVIEAEIESGNIDYAQLNCVGFSLGAHICGYLGNLEENISVIVGLEPAGPLFTTDISPLRRLTNKDANTVHVLHTDRGGLGTLRDDGDANFYINTGSRLQPGCTNLFDRLCSHYRSYVVFKEAILNGTAGVAVRCNSYLQFTLQTCGNVYYFLRFPVDTNAEGKLYLSTNSNQPYLRGNRGTYP